MASLMQLPVDDNLLQSAFQATGLKNAAEVIEFALRELLRRENQKKILELKGKVEWRGDLEAMRAMRHFDDPG